MRGIFSVLLGICILVFPWAVSVTFAVIIGIAAIIYGLYAFIASFNIRKKHKDWWMIMVEGILGVLLGIMIIVWPFAAIFITAILVACWMMVIGLMTIFQAIELRKEIEGEGWYIVSGILAFLTGILMISLPAAGAGILIYLLGIFAIAYGIILFFTVGKVNNLEEKIEKVEEKIEDAIKDHIDD